MCRLSAKTTRFRWVADILLLISFIIVLPGLIPIIYDPNFWVIYIIGIRLSRVLKVSMFSFIPAFANSA